MSDRIAGPADVPAAKRVLLSREARPTTGAVPVRRRRAVALARTVPRRTGWGPVDLPRGGTYPATPQRPFRRRTIT
jgi:hypothetical protein